MKHKFFFYDTEKIKVPDKNRENENFRQFLRKFDLNVRQKLFVNLKKKLRQILLVEFNKSCPKFIHINVSERECFSHRSKRVVSCMKRRNIFKIKFVIKR